ncbi:hypothetical protein RIF29_40591 [Crotalaria pallida]|uniref:4Fe-4S ferredoxin-type domain-containing protein n=1 Tax=Crotalaria pallida TaxID=3830 RepID=A0AAN9E5T7_CROPI
MDDWKMHKRYDIDMTKCIYCGFCQEACPVDAIVCVSRIRRNRVVEENGWSLEDTTQQHLEDLPAELFEEEFRLGLRTGIILCNVLNKVQPDMMTMVFSCAVIHFLELYHPLLITTSKVYALGLKVMAVITKDLNIGMQMYMYPWRTDLDSLISSIMQLTAAPNDPLALESQSCTRSMRQRKTQNAHRHKIEEEVALVATMGVGRYAFHEHHEKKEAKEQDEEAHGK